jgi:hypothetical protein
MSNSGDWKLSTDSKRSIPNKKSNCSDRRCRLESQAPLLKKPQLEKSMKELRAQAVEMIYTAVSSHMTKSLDRLKAGAVLAARKVGLMVRFCTFCWHAA